MTAQLYLALGIAAGQLHTDQDPVLMRDAEIARQEERRARRTRR